MLDSRFPSSRRVSLFHPVTTDDETGRPPPFRKVLYLRQPYPDNYVDASFLADLKRNVNVHPASLPHLLRQTLPITQHLSATILFISVFVQLSRSTLPSTSLLLTCAFLALIFRLWAAAIGESRADWVGGARGVVPLAALYLLSPALKTLTRATTSDSIWALSGALFALNLALGDYRAIPTHSSSSLSALSPRRLFTSSTFSTSATPSSAPPGQIGMARRSPLPSTVSLTAALSGSTVLASRLSSNTSVFSLLLFAFLWFGPFPLLRSSLTLRPTLILTWALATVALVGLRGLEAPGATALAAAALFGTSVVAPLVRGWLAVRYKDRLSGPWDVVAPKVGGEGGHLLGGAGG
ncbi:hypothetical protein JCM8097_000295 [Rhodosporidiobolus ruineniae]